MSVTECSACDSSGEQECGGADYLSDPPYNKTCIECGGSSTTPILQGTLVRFAPTYVARYPDHSSSIGIVSAAPEGRYLSIISVLWLSGPLAGKEQRIPDIRLERET